MRINLIPMAGRGQRFQEAGYALPKPLIPVAGTPMMFRVIDDLPPAEKWIFVVRREHVERYGIDVILEKKLPGAEIVVEEAPTGQLTSCLMARTHIQPNDELLIAACDSGYEYDAQRFLELRGDDSIDAIYWTFTEHNILRDRPEAWGWCELEEDGQTIRRVSVKKPISEDPFHDHAVTGTFFFRKASDFFAAAEHLMARGDMVNGEFYVDSVANDLRELGKRTVIFDVDRYMGWGRPEDLRAYEKKEPPR